MQLYNIICNTYQRTPILKQTFIMCVTQGHKYCYYNSVFFSYLIRPCLQIYNTILSQIVAYLASFKKRYTMKIDWISVWMKLVEVLLGFSTGKIPLLHEMKIDRQGLILFSVVSKIIVSLIGPSIKPGPYPENVRGGVGQNCQ